MTGTAAAPDLPSRLAASLREQPELLPSGARVLVALSGGPDSMALLHLLLELADDRGLSLAAAHFDHAVRPGSAGEAETVRRWAGEAGVACRVGRPEGELERSQEAFRSARYAFLEEEADRVGADRVATGHHADDQAETVLFRVLRGTGIRGLRGIPRRRGRVVRPLLPFWREEIEAWLEARSLPFLEDPSNDDPRWDRVRIRDEVLPALESAWGEPVRERLVALARSAARADRALERGARELLDRAVIGEGGPWGEEAYRLALGPLRRADPELRTRAVRRAARTLDVRLSRGGTRQAAEFISEGASGGRVDLGGGLVLAREFDELWLGRPREPRPDEELVLHGPEAGRGEARIGGRRLAVAWEPLRGPGADAGPAAVAGRDGGDRPPDGRGHRVALPLDRLEFPLRVRAWRDGDRLERTSGTRKLKKLFNDLKIPLSERDRLPLLVADSGRVLWGARVGRDASMAPREGEDVLVVTVEDR